MESEDIGELIDLALQGRHESYRGFADKNPPLNVKTLMSAIRANRNPIPRTRGLIEGGLGWKPGTIDWLWANHQWLNLSDLDPFDPRTSGEEALRRDASIKTPVKPVQVSKAKGLTDQELITELASRLLGRRR